MEDPCQQSPAPTEMEVLCWEIKIVCTDLLRANRNEAVTPRSSHRVVRHAPYHSVLTRWADRAAPPWAAPVKIQCDKEQGIHFEDLYLGFGNLNFLFKQLNPWLFTDISGPLSQTLISREKHGSGSWRGGNAHKNIQVVTIPCSGWAHALLSTFTVPNGSYTLTTTSCTDCWRGGSCIH